MKASRNLCVLPLFALGLTFQVAGLAQAPAAVAPVLTVTPASGTVLHKSDGMDIVRVTATYPTGFKYLTLMGAYSSTRVFQASGKTVTLALSFFVSYYPAGKYPFVTTATDLNGKTVTKTVMLTLTN